MIGYTTNWDTIVADAVEGAGPATPSNETHFTQPGHTQAAALVDAQDFLSMSQEEQAPRAVEHAADEVVEPWYGSEFLREFHELRANTNPHGRGHKLEDLLERVFRRAHYHVVHNPDISKPRQTDFTVSLRNERYLVEAKWEKDPVDVSVVAGIRDRIGRTDTSVVGVLISVSDINSSAMQDIVNRRDRGLVLVFNEADILKMLEDPHELDRLLRRKHHELVVNARVDRGKLVPEKSVGSSERLNELHGSHFQLLDADMNPVPYFSGLGEFNPYVFSLELPDIDWAAASGSGVFLDIPVTAWSQQELIDLLHGLDGIGWVTPRAHWSIQQHGANWHGIGPRDFIRALEGWEPRTSDLTDPHHSEEFVYFDACDGGFYTISGILSAHPVRQLRECTLSFQLTGTPLDPGPLQHLYSLFKAPRRGYFRPRVEKSVHRKHLSGVDLTVRGYILEPGEHSLDRSPWIVGLAVDNPFFGDGHMISSDWIYGLHESGVLLCALRSHHPADEPRSAYSLFSVEAARSSDANVYRVFADW